jgi:hypothetical protein
MKRTAPLKRDDGKARATVAVPRTKRCAKTKGGCGEWFLAMRPMAAACSPRCAEGMAATKRQRAESKAKADEGKKDRAKREAMKTRSQLLAEAKREAQRFRRLEELAKGSGCISCKRSQAEVEGTEGWKPGGAWDGGHFLGKGARPELALEPMNIWLQCKSCNGGSGQYARKGYTVHAAFRVNLIEEVGLAAVEALEADHAPRHHSADQLREIRDTYRAKVRELTRQAESGCAGMQAATSKAG